MASVFRWLQRKSQDYTQYEQVLAALDTSIREASADLDQERLNAKGLIHAWYYYNVPLFLLVATILAQLSRTLWSNDPWAEWLGRLSPIAAYPIIIFVGGRCINFIYRRRIGSRERHLERLRAKQKLKLEELKKSTGYYVTKGIVERYEHLQEQQEEQHQDAHPENGSGSAEVEVAPAPVDEPNGPEGLASDAAVQQLPALDGGENPFVVPPANPPGFAGSIGGGHRIIPMPRKRQQVFDTLMTSTIRSPKRNVYDRVIDWIVGDPEAPTQTYALVCEQCRAHCGLALPQDFFTMEYVCPYCSHFNSKLKNLGPVSPALAAPHSDAERLVPAPAVDPPSDNEALRRRNVGAAAEEHQGAALDGESSAASSRSPSPPGRGEKQKRSGGSGKKKRGGRKID